jgi:flagellar biosynthesis protein
MKRYVDLRKNVPDRAAAAALAYDPAGDQPPEVVAAGRGLQADAIVAAARKHGVPIREDAGLVQALSRVDVGTLIPRELYAVVAEVLAYVYAVDAAAGTPKT